ncbi:MFS antiporter QDR2 [Spathaspora sp. JA1]|nr:MFS antiporter QDR2 [Spathaspora sp. JA1]
MKDQETSNAVDADTKIDDSSHEDGYDTEISSCFSDQESVESKTDSHSDLDKTYGKFEQINLNKHVSVSEKEVYPYTIFLSKDRILLIIILSLVGFWSAVSSPIYFPALPTMQNYFHTSPAMTNASVVAYLVFQGLAPTISSNLADTFGKRPVILGCILIYIGSCIAISQINNYTVLVILRCIQAAGIAPVISISSGVSGDVCTPATRGGMVGVVAGLQLAGNGLGGLIGALLISSFNTWRSIFIFLTIGGGVTFALAFFLLPETSRSIVGNGSIFPDSWLNKSIFIKLPHLKSRMTNDVASLEPKNPFDLLGPYKIFFQKIVFLTLLPSGLHFAAWTMVLTSLSTELESRKYNYSVMQVGLIYLPQGLACFVGSIAIGRLMNWYYRLRKTQYEQITGDLPLTERHPFNIVSTRLVLCIVPSILMIIGLIIFGWCIQTSQPIISIIISTCLISMSSSMTMSVSATLLVDLFPTQGSASASCVNLMRCLLAAFGAGVLDLMISKLNLGGTYTMIAGLSLVADMGFIYVIYIVNQKLKGTFL